MAAMSQPKPNDPAYRPFVFESDFAAIGAQVAVAPTLDVGEYNPNEFDPALVGEEHYRYQRLRLEALSREGLSGSLAQPPWERTAGAQGPAELATIEARDAERRALHGGLPDAPESVPRPRY